MSRLGTGSWIAHSLEDRVVRWDPDEALCVGRGVDHQAGVAGLPLSKISIEDVIVTKNNVPGFGRVDLEVQRNEWMIAKTLADRRVVDDRLDAH